MGKRRRASPIEPYLTGNGGSRAGGHPGEKDSLSSVEARPQCTYRCVVLPAGGGAVSGSSLAAVSMHLQVRGAPCHYDLRVGGLPTLMVSQCTYRCVVLPDEGRERPGHQPESLNAPTGAWCSLTLS